MFTVIIISAIVSAALIAGALWGLYGPLGERTEGFLIALAGGALIISVVSELIEPSAEKAGLAIVAGAVAVGAIVFTAVDWWIDEKWNSEGGGGLLAAIALDGIPENLALGVALIGAGPMEVAALAGSIFLSNLPEAAGGAREMRKDGRSRRNALLLWSATAGILAISAIVGNVVMENASEETLGIVRGLAAGAVVASLATEVFPKAFKDDRHLAGIATAIGLLLALWLGHLGV